jgi:hypothetical protein
VTDNLTSIADFSTSKVIKAIRCTRNEFSKFFELSQQLTNILASQQMQFETLSAEIPNDQDAFGKALDYAREYNFLTPLLTLIGKSGLEDGSVAEALISGSELHSMINNDTGFINPLIYSKGIIRVVQFTGKVIINGQPMGTGVLIGPNLFLTAWHVVKRLFKQVGSQENGEPNFEIDPSPQNIEIEFNNILDVIDGNLKAINSVKVAAHQDWLIYHSVCHSTELDNTLQVPKIEDRLLDYVIIKLANPIGYERRWVSLEQTAEPVLNKHMILLQHPAGIPLKMDQSTVTGWTPTSSKLRFLHSLNALGGSSGGPCFDKEFKLVGIHQGAWSELVAGSRVNRGIPIKKIIQNFSIKYPTLPAPDPAECKLWALDPQMASPIIGCDEFQTVVWSMAISSSKRIISLNGYPQSGKTFLIGIANALLSESDHLKIVLAGQTIASLDVISLCNHIFSLIGGKPPSFVGIQEYNSTPAAWIRDEMVPKLMEALQQKRAGRLVWICVTDLNKYSLQGQYASDFMLMLYEQVLSCKWLRCVLDGISRIQISLSDIVIKHNTTSITVRDLELFLVRFFSYIQLPFYSPHVAPTAQFLFRQYSEHFATDQSTAMFEFSNTVKNFVSSYLKH